MFHTFTPRSGAPNIFCRPLLIVIKSSLDPCSVHVVPGNNRWQSLLLPVTLASHSDSPQHRLLSDASMIKNSRQKQQTVQASREPDPAAKLPTPQRDTARFRHPAEAPWRHGHVCNILQRHPGKTSTCQTPAAETPWPYEHTSATPWRDTLARQTHMHTHSSSTPTFRSNAPAATLRPGAVLPVHRVHGTPSQDR